MNTHQAYGFDSVNQDGRKVQTAVQLFTKDSVVTVAIRTRTYAKTKKPTYTEKNIGINLDSFVKIANIVNQLLSETENESNPTD